MIPGNGDGSSLLEHAKSESKAEPGKQPEARLLRCVVGCGEGVVMVMGEKRGIMVLTNFKQSRFEKRWVKQDSSLVSPLSSLLSPVLPSPPPSPPCSFLPLLICPFFCIALSLCFSSSQPLILNLVSLLHVCTVCHALGLLFPLPWSFLYLYLVLLLAHILGFPLLVV